MKTAALFVGAVVLALSWMPARADSPSGTSATDAISIARESVDTGLRDRVVSIYGVGAPTAVKTWWIIFYDPSVPSHGRAVEVEHGSVTKAYEAKGGVVYSDKLTFSASQATSESRALASAQDYAAKHALAYDNVRVLLRTTEPGTALRWRVQLRDGAKSRGFVFVNATDGVFAMYSPPGAVPTKDNSTTGGGVEGDVKRAANEVKGTFLGIGGDLQEFFTGDRTVDQ